MARVICSLPHLHSVVSGVKFVIDRGEAISEEIADDAAALFASIPGYRLVEVAVGGKRGGAKSPDAKADAKAESSPAETPVAEAPKSDASKPAAPADASKADEPKA